MGLFAYRNGNDSVARNWILRSLANSFKPAQLTTSNKILLGMIHLRTQEPEEARKLADEARITLQEWESAPFKLGASDDFWFDWVNARILLDELDLLLAASGG
jgi:hypothetical protein